MTDRDAFLAWVQSALYDAEVAVHNGDAAPRRAIWPGNEPVSILGALRNAYGRQEVDEAFTVLETSFSDCTSYTFELQSFDVVGDMAFTAGSSTPRPLWTARRAVTPCGPPRCTAVKAASGRWPIGTPTPCPSEVPRRVR